MIHKRLSECLPGQHAIIISLSGNPQFKQRLREMGFIKGVEIFIEKQAPLSDPVEYVIKGYHISLRKNETKNIVVEIIQPNSKQ